LQVMRANQANVRNNSAELYTAFLGCHSLVGSKTARAGE
jgi:hypothetical protein